MVRNKELSFCPECYVDTNLVSTLLSTEVNHKYACSKVVNYVISSTTFAVGIIDKDKRKPTGYDRFKLLYQSEIFNILYIPNDHKYLIVINSIADRMLFNCATDCRLDLNDYNLPNNFKDFLNRTKCNTSNRDKDIRRLIRTLSKLHPGLKKLQVALLYLKEKRYLVNANELLALLNES